MAEDLIVAAFARKITSHLSFQKKKNEPHAAGKLRFFPCTWATGTDKRPFNTCTVRGVEGSTLPQVDKSTVSAYFLTRCDSTGDHPSWLPLLADHQPGELLVRQRGKGLLIAAGSVLVLINFSRVGCLAQCSSDEFRHLTAQCVPGGNLNASKAHAMRSFLAPPELFVPGSRARRSRDLRRLNILLAVESEGAVFFVVDHNRLTKLDVLYREKHWTHEDVEKSSVWPETLGPDWVTESADAWAQADTWRAGVLAARTSIPLADALQTNHTTFNGFGRQTAADVCHRLQLHPVTPAYAVCENDVEWNRIKQVLTDYLASLRRPSVLRCTAATINSDYPFQFHAASSRYFINNCIAVFRRRDVRIPKQDWLTMQSKGLFSSEHVIGDEPGNDQTVPALRSESVAQPVYLYRVGSKAYYTAIQARPPPEWAMGTLHAHGDTWKDLRLDGDTPTIGPQQFHIYTINRVHEADWSEYVASLRQAAIDEGVEDDDVEPLPLLDDAGISLDAEQTVKE
ncbi:hypothetical protein EXIGLDRAFT_838490 [Exidia glandulosa HHB12029]|uniref:Uncharacterized protein n=1 Tax=Exidia glandulosa HHB12029 TaxID=1314781 RepID=A0A165FSJ8_EXIGL|nr:hypothetical protein EXIGLDRAFT_838490 [Exidia glandulosa HHB12029]